MQALNENKPAIILVNKPKGISSNTVVNIVKKAVKADKAGHLGTLDVAGEGLLPVTLNKATRLFDYFLDKDKQYIANFIFGKTTDTLDLEGEIVKFDNTVITASMIEKIIPKFIGKQLQLPPQYSAKKVNGQNAYSLARKGIEVDLKPKEIEIYDLALLKSVGTNEFQFKIQCSSGTYIRSLCRDMAEALSTVGVMSYIQRTRCGVFDLKNAYTLEEIKNGNYKLIAPETLFTYPSIKLNETILNGQMNMKIKNGLYKGYLDDSFVGIIEAVNDVIRFKLRLI